MDIVYFDNVEKEIRKLPLHIKIKLLEWAKSVEIDGIRQVRLLKGFHDEPLLGDRKGQRSIRLSKSYRAIYTEQKDGLFNSIIIQEVNKHDY